jgi:uncharacterized SAM-binding protein YcdF (DUF218 family)
MGARAQADVIVVLGCRLTADGAPSPALARRVACGVALYQTGIAPRLLLSGGGGARRSEAAVMREMALAAGVPDDAILVEERSPDTLGNAVETARLMRAAGLSTLVLVSDRYHLPRARLLFRLAGACIVAVHSPRERGATPAWRWLAKEAAALPWSLLRLAVRSLRRRRRGASGGR